MKSKKHKLVKFTHNEEINVPSLDKQHFKMSCLINNVNNGFEMKDNNKIEENLSELLKLLEQHFSLEEKLMKETKFPGYISHKLEHDRFYEKIRVISFNYRKNNSILTSELLSNIKNWFYNHIEISDKKCGEHFVALGIK